MQQKKTGAKAPNHTENQTAETARVGRSGLSTRRLSEGAICLALSLALCYLKIPVGFGTGGSIDFVMIPLLVFAVRWGLGWGTLVGFSFGVLKYFIGNGFAISWVSIFLDYAFAYAAVGFAGLFRPSANAERSKNTAGASDASDTAHTASTRVKANPYRLFPLATFVGCFARFLVHFVSGITVYRMYMPEVFLNLPMTSATVYSILYNGLYMLPNTVIALILAFVLRPLLPRLGGRHI